MEHELGDWEDSRGQKNDGKWGRSCFMHDSLYWQNYHSHALQRWLGETVLTPTSSYDHQQMNLFLDVIVGKHKAK